MLLLRPSLVLSLSLFSIASIVLVCLFDSRIAAAPTTIMAMTNSASPMASESQPVDQAATKSIIKSAKSFDSFIFWIYGFFLVGLVILTVLHIYSGNKVQEAIKADADARLKSSEEKVAALTAETEKAREEIAKGQADAATANERAVALELEKDEQRERMTKAEMELFELQERLKPRRLTSTQRNRLTDELSRAEKSKIVINFLSGNAESQDFATDIAEVLQSSGWTVPKMGAIMPIGGKVPVG